MPTKHVLLIQPKSFGYNEETASDNTFQKKSTTDSVLLNQQAKAEFEHLVELLRNNGVEVSVVADSPEQNTPDSVFPNNWISTHQSGEIFIYPMMAKSRRKEIRQDIIDQLKTEFRFSKVIDFTNYTNDNLFLEGTGSMVLDRENFVAYCCLSERSHLPVLTDWTKQMNYEMVYFNSFNEKSVPIYHTNVMLTLAKDYAVICLDSIHDIEERIMVIENLENNGKEVIEITYEQLNQFAGNMIELANDKGESLIVMSQAALDSLDNDQRERLSKHSTIIASPIPIIEENGGGSVRCMIAEVFPPN